MERRLVEELLTSPDNIAQAGKRAGYGRRQWADTAFKNVQRKMPEIMEELGLTDEYIGKRIKEGCEGIETKFFHSNGIVMQTEQVIPLRIRPLWAHSARGAKASSCRRGDYGNPIGCEPNCAPS